MMEIVDETQVEFVCASGVRIRIILSGLPFLEEGDLAIDAEGGK